MLKILFINEENLPEIMYSTKIFVDSEAPTDIIIVSCSAPIRLRLRFKDTEEVDNFMEILFEGDKINLASIKETAPEMEITVEEDDFYSQFSVDSEMFENMEDFDDDYDDED